MTRSCHALLPLVLLVGAPGLGHARAEPLRLALPASPGIAYSATLAATVLRPFTTATHQPVRLVSTGWDLAVMDPLTLAEACAKGSIRKLDWPALGGSVRFLPVAVSDCGAGAALSATVLTWDAGKSDATPSWADFWDVTRFPGQRGLRKSPVGTLEIALLADGVAPRDVYGVLRSKDGLNRAFRKLDQLRPYIVWWQSDREPMQIVAAGHALMSSAPSEQVTQATRRLHRAFGLGWNGAIVSSRAWAIAAATQQGAAAEALIARATTPAAQAQMVAQTGWGSTLTPDPKGAAPDGPGAHLASEVALDTGFWRDNRAALETRFAAWLKR